MSTLHHVASSSSHCFLAFTPWFVLLCKLSLVLARPFRRLRMLFVVSYVYLHSNIHHTCFSAAYFGR